jgi:hypothetical protein
LIHCVFTIPSLLPIWKVTPDSKCTSQTFGSLSLSPLRLPLARRTRTRDFVTAVPETLQPTSPSVDTRVCSARERLIRFFFLRRVGVARIPAGDNVTTCFLRHTVISGVQRTTPANCEYSLYALPVIDSSTNDFGTITFNYFTLRPIIQ